MRLRLLGNCQLLQVSEGTERDGAGLGVLRSDDIEDK
jgi:hypothetical protein